jgi:hypothetical protein
MKKIIFSLVAVFFLAPWAFAEAPVKPVAPAAATAPAAPTPVTYELRDLKPTGITQYTAVGDIVRQYFDFQNEQGSHHVIYEEIPSAAPAHSVVGLRQMASSFESLCAMDIECSSKAFCTGDCKHMYYEVANAPGDAGAPDRNKCKIHFFSCEKAPAEIAVQKPSALPAAPAAATETGL